MCQNLFIASLNLLWIQTQNLSFIANQPKKPDIHENVIIHCDEWGSKLVQEFLHQLRVNCSSFKAVIRSAE